MSKVLYSVNGRIAANIVKCDDDSIHYVDTASIGSLGEYGYETMSFPAEVKFCDIVQSKFFSIDVMDFNVLDWEEEMCMSYTSMDEALDSHHYIITHLESYIEKEELENG